MEKLTRILAAVDKVEDGAVVLEKAVVLARRFGARIDLLLHESLHAQAFATLCSTLHYNEVTLTSLHREAEPLHEVVLRRALATMPDLIMKAASGARPLKRWTCDVNDSYLANASPVPLLLVRHKAWSSPTRFAAAVDVAGEAPAETARSVLHTAGFLTLGCRGHIDILYSERERADESVRMSRAARLSQLVREFHVGGERIQIFEGSPETTLPPIAAARQYDVLVLGARTHRHQSETLFGTMTSQLVEATDGDVVLVNAPLRSIPAEKHVSSFRKEPAGESKQLR
jgi:nucleotide-binding universal stress UspA family protein